MSSSLKAALDLDGVDKLRGFRSQFYIPKSEDGPWAYFVGNSLGLQPKNTEKAVFDEIQKWRDLGCEGHFSENRPWYSYHEIVSESLARLAGAKPSEVVAMNSLTANLHILLTRFFKPTKERYKILIEKDSFPSDRYAVASHLEFHGLDPKTDLIEIGENGLISDEMFSEVLQKHGEQTALVVLGHTHFISGQSYPIESWCQQARKLGITFGLDLAHGMGNVELKLHSWEVDFAVWCSYKYLNSGPGAIGGAFIHEKHHSGGPSLWGWWGHNKSTRFEFPHDFSPIGNAESFQLSNPPILQLAALKASLEVFDQVPFSALVEKSQKMTTYLETLLSDVKSLNLITPKSSRGCQLTYKTPRALEMQKALQKKGVICDYRAPEFLRMAPVPLYNSYTDCFRLFEELRKI